MEFEVISLIRTGLQQELEKFEGETAKLNVRSDIAEAVLFNTDEFGMKTFAFPVDLMKKINFEGISFDGFFAYGFDFTGFKGVSIDPQKVFDADLSYANLNGVTITNTFDDVTLEGVKSEGMIYKTWENRFKNCQNTGKKL